MPLDWMKKLPYLTKVIKLDVGKLGVTKSFKIVLQPEKRRNFGLR